MNIETIWQKPIPLTLKKGSWGYEINLEALPLTSGVYVFSRKHGNGDCLEPLYIGKALNLRNRIKTQMKNLELMGGIYGSKTGKRFLSYCTVNYKQGQQPRKIISILEKALIESALYNGYEILNDKLTKIPSHTITFKGNRECKEFAPTTLKIKKD